MKVSVIVPVHNGQRFILEALASLGAQTRAPDEIVIVDDGSTDDTSALVGQSAQSCLIHYLFQPQQGPAAARNAGLAAASGDVLAFLDSDDVLAPRHLETALECLAADPELGMVQGLILRQRWHEGRFVPEQGPYQFVNLGSLVVRREVFDRVGPFAAELWENEDTDWLMRAWEHSIAKKVVPRISLYYRIHQTNLVHSQRLQAGGVATLLRRHLQRMRASGQSTEKVVDRPSWDDYRGNPEQEMEATCQLEVARALGPARGWKQMGRTDRAIQSCQAVLQQHPQMEAAQRLLLEQLVQAGRAWEGLDLCDQLLQRYPAETALHLTRSHCQAAWEERQLPDQPEGRLCLQGQIRFASHRSGWGYALDALHPLHNRQGILFDGFVENNFAWRYPKVQGVVPYRQPWVGFLHNPPAMPPGFHDHATPQAIVARGVWQDSLEFCQGLFTLSDYLGDWLRAQTAVPVEVLRLPSETPRQLFEPEKFLLNPHPKIVQVGWWLRRLTSIYRLPVYEHYQKVWLVTLPFVHARNHFLKLMEQEGGRPHCDNTKELEQLGAEEYDDLLSRNIAFADLWDTSANCTVVECIVRATPLLVNPLPAIVEYLGPGYPFFFQSLPEAAEKAMDLQLVVKTHEYLKQLPLRQELSGEAFRSSFVASSIYQKLR